jgi:hypothetical protein
LFLDAAHYDQAWTIYDRSPRGKTRPEYDRTLEPLRGALKAQGHVMLPGGQAHEIQRALAIGTTMGINTMVYGVQGGYEIADELAEQNVTVLLDVNWPEPPKDADPEADVPLRTLAPHLTRYWPTCARRSHWICRPTRRSVRSR